MQTHLTKLVAAGRTSHSDPTSQSRNRAPMPSHVTTTSTPSTHCTPPRSRGPSILSSRNDFTVPRLNIIFISKTIAQDSSKCRSESLPNSSWRVQPAPWPQKRRTCPPRPPFPPYPLPPDLQNVRACLVPFTNSRSQKMLRWGRRAGGEINFWREKKFQRAATKPRSCRAH